MYGGYGLLGSVVLFVAVIKILTARKGPFPWLESQTCVVARPSRPTHLANRPRVAAPGLFWLWIGLPCASGAWLEVYVCVCACVCVCVCATQAP